MRRVMVDMSATLLHHGHIRLLRIAKTYGYVVVALTTDEDVRNKKGYEPELDFQSRREILESIRYVDEVIPSPWVVDEIFLKTHCIDFLVHGTDNVNPIASERVLLFPRTSGISSSIMRGRVLKATSEVYLNKE
jgi:glycerol-3-phosphate cytidylyltransferase